MAAYIGRDKRLRTVVENMLNGRELNKTHRKILLSQQIKVRLHSGRLAVIGTSVVKYSGVDSLSSE